MTSKSKTTTIEYREAVSDADVGALRDASQDAKATEAAMVRAYEDVESGLLSASEDGPLSDEEIAALRERAIGRLVQAEAVVHFTAKLRAARATLREATTAAIAVQSLRDPHAVRFAELAVERLTAALSRVPDYLGSISVSPMTSTPPDHTGNMRGAVRVTVTGSPMSAGTLFGVLRTAVQHVSGDGRSYVYGWAATLTDPEVQAATAAKGQREDGVYRALTMHAIGDFQ